MTKRDRTFLTNEISDPIHVITIPQDEYLKWPVFTEAEEVTVLRILRDGNVSTHPVIQELEAD